METVSVLVVDDEPGVREALGAILTDEGYRVESADSGERGVEMASRGRYDAILLDVWLPGIDGLETLGLLRDRRVDAEVVMISGHGTIDTAVRATKLGAFDFVEKPLSLEKTLVVLRNALRQRRLERRNRRLLEQLAHDTEILGRSGAIAAARDAVAAAAATDAPVLVRGERGTGRETIARSLHGSSRRAVDAFVEVPCAALDAASAAETLFGPAGRIRLARGGTLFLEDADRLEEGVQVRLAGALDDPQGEGAEVRVVASAGPAATGLHAALRERLDVVRIDVPPLRERREDVPLLAERFMRDLAREYGRQEKRWSAEALAALQGHGWPGNVRELRNLVERVLLTASGEVVGLSDLPSDFGGGPDLDEDLFREFSSLREGVEAFERYFVRRAVRESSGDLDAAARRLRIERPALDTYLARK